MKSSKINKMTMHVNMAISFAALCKSLKKTTTADTPAKIIMFIVLEAIAETNKQRGIQGKKQLHFNNPYAPDYAHTAVNLLLKTKLHQAMGKPVQVSKSLDQLLKCVTERLDDKRANKFFTKVICESKTAMDALGNPTTKSDLDDIKLYVLFYLTFRRCTTYVGEAN